MIAWYDGRAFEDLRLLVYRNGEYNGWYPVGDDGKFDLMFYGDFEYSLEALDDGERFPGKAERFTLKEGSSTGLKFVLRRVRK